MRLKFGLLAIVIALLVSCAEPEPPPPAEQLFIDNVTTALGGSAAIEATSTLTMTGSGRMLNVGQDLTPDATTMVFDLSDYRRSLDFANQSSQTGLTRTPLFDYFRGRDPARLVWGLDGDVAYDIAADGSARRAHENVAAERRSAFYHHPLALVRAVLLNRATLSNVRDEVGLTLADITIESGKVFTLAIDASTHLPTYIRSTDHHFYLRDVVRETTFADYAPAGDLRLPTVISLSFDEFHVSRFEADEQRPNDPDIIIGAPPGVIATPPISGTPPARVVAEQLADGIWRLAGQSHHSVLFEFSDHLMLLEAPNETRTLAVIDAATELVPGKPVTHLINTHHHFDHSGGVRAAVAAGITIITQAANEDFYRRMAEQPSTLVPDALALAPRPIRLETVQDSARYSDETMTVELYHVAGNPHSHSMLIAYVPRDRLLIEADLYNPGRSTPQLFAPNLMDNIRNYELNVERVVPIHGDVIDFEEMEEAVEALARR